MVTIVIAVTIYLFWVGHSYYSTTLEERFYHEHHDWFKPSGLFGHGLGIVGTLMILFGVLIYIARKRYNFLSKFIRLKYLLEFHIFLCTLGPILVLFHTAFKFGGIVSIAFWSMIAVVLSGVIGRFIYIQIPRTIEGRELSLSEVTNMRINLSNELASRSNISQTTITLDNLEGSLGILESKPSYIKALINNRKKIRLLKRELKQKKISRAERTTIISIAKSELSLNQKIQRLESMQTLFKYWHVAHLPFALIMLIIVVIHVAITLIFGYKWIF